LHDRLQLIGGRWLQWIEEQGDIGDQKEQKRRLQVAICSPLSLGVRVGAMAKIEDSSAKSDSWQSRYWKGMALLLIGFIRSKQRESLHRYSTVCLLAGESIQMLKARLVLILACVNLQIAIVCASIDNDDKSIAFEQVLEFRGRSSVS
jgi:hypothetical protein